MKFLSNVVADGHSNNRGAFDGAVEVSVDFGSTPVMSAAFTISTPATVGARVLMVPTSRVDGDELELDGFACAAHVSAADTIKAFIHAVPGPVSGVKYFNLLFR